MKVFNRWGIYLAWVIASFSVLSSLYASEILNLQPCIYCWLQRCFMFPLAVILGLMAYKNDKKVIFYVLPLPVIGALIAIYQTIVTNFEFKYLGCGFECSEANIKMLGIVDMSVLSFISFALIFVLLILSRKKN